MRETKNGNEDNLYGTKMERKIGLGQNSAVRFLVVYNIRENFHRFRNNPNVKHALANRRKAYFLGKNKQSDDSANDMAMMMRCLV